MQHERRRDATREASLRLLKLRMEEAILVERSLHSAVLAHRRRHGGGGGETEVRIGVKVASVMVVVTATLAFNDM